MKNITKISKRGMILGMVFSILLFSFIYFASGALAVSAERGDFVILGRTAEDGKGGKEIINEKVDLWIQAGVYDIVQARVESGTVVLVLDKKVVGAQTFYIVSTVGKDGGLMGWVSEDCIYEIVPEPKL
jgi:hypothetical protein